MNIVQVYVPTSDKEEQDVESFYEQIDVALKLSKTKDITIVMGDFNAKIRKVKTDNLVGNFGWGDRMRD